MSQRAIQQTVVEWPHAIVSSNADDTDLGPPLKQLLQDLDILGTSADVAKVQKSTTAVARVPVSVSIIEAGATAASKGWAAVVAALGGATAVWGAVTNFWNGQTPATRGTLAIAAAVVIAACALGVGLIMSADVRARGQGATAQYHARAAVASAFLSGATSATRATSSTTAAQAVSNAQLKAASNGGKVPPLANGNASATGNASTLWVRPIKLTNEPDPWRPVLAYSLQGAPPTGETLYFIQGAAGQEPQWMSIHDVDGWKVSTSDPGTPSK